MSTPEPTALSGEITVTLALPDGLPRVERVTVSMNPKTTEEFEQLLEALGGVTAWRYVLDEFVSFDIPGGMVFLYFPTDIASAPPTTPAREFASRLHARKERVIEDTARLDAAFGVTS